MTQASVTRSNLVSDTQIAPQLEVWSKWCTEGWDIWNWEKIPSSEPLAATSSCPEYSSRVEERRILFVLFLFDLDTISSSSSLVRSMISRFVGRLGLDRSRIDCWGLNLYEPHNDRVSRDHKSVSRQEVLYLTGIWSLSRPSWDEALRLASLNRV